MRTLFQDVNNSGFQANYILTLQHQDATLADLRTTVPLSSTSGTPSDFGIMLPLVPVVKILKKNWGHLENLGESGGQTFKGSDRGKCQF